MPPALPPDRAVALACSVRSLRHLWLHVECCTETTVPLCATTRAGTLADLVMALRCAACGALPRRAMLLVDPAGVARQSYGVERWRLFVIGEDESDPAFPVKLAVVGK